MRRIIKNHKSQAELITTVLLILVAIAAVWFVSSFVIDLVKNYLKPADCFKTAGQLVINTEGDYTYYDSNTSRVHLSITRGEGEFNLTGISVVLSSGANSKIVKLITGVSSVATMFSGTSTLVIPDPQETKTYIINNSLGEPVTKVSIAPLLIGQNNACKEVDSKNLIVK